MLMLPSASVVWLVALHFLAASTVAAQLDDRIAVTAIDPVFIPISMAPASTAFSESATSAEPLAELAPAISVEPILEPAPTPARTSADPNAKAVEPAPTRPNASTDLKPDLTLATTARIRAMHTVALATPTPSIKTTLGRPVIIFVIVATVLLAGSVAGGLVYARVRRMRRAGQQQAWMPPAAEVQQREAQAPPTYMEATGPGARVPLMETAGWRR